MKAYCPNCKKQTNSDVLKEERIGSSGDDDYEWTEVHYFLKCRGCDTFSYAIATTTEADWDPQTGECYVTWKNYPSGNGARTEMEDWHSFPPKLAAVYKEVVGAMNAQLPVLAGIGLRVLIEGICNEKGVPGKDLKEKIDGLASAGVMAADQAALLHSHRFLGNVAAHEITAARPKELVAALEIAETVLKTLYILPELSAEIKTGKPA
jgi:hypothetical protein